MTRLAVFIHSICCYTPICCLLRNLIGYHVKFSMSRNRHAGAILAVMVTLLLACATFILDEEIDGLKSVESGTYKMLKDVSANDLSLSKGESVKLMIRANDISIKVYAYSADQDLLKSKRVLILHLFQDDFKDERFNRDGFDRKLGDVVTRK